MKTARSGRLAACIAALLPLAPHANASDAPEPLHVRVELNGANVAECEGGEWTLRWEGDVPAESADIEEQIISYTAFDTSHAGGDEDEESSLSDLLTPLTPHIAPPSLTTSPVTCYGPDGEPGMRANFQQQAGRARVTLSLAEPAFHFSADDLGVCTLRIPGGAPIDIPGASIGINPNTVFFSPELSITEDDLRKGFSMTFDVSGTALGVANNCMGTDLLSGTVQLRYKMPDDPEVKMDGCPYVGFGSPIEVTAEGTPTPGNYRFSADGGGVMVSQQGSSATYTSMAPGETKLRVDYTAGSGTASDEMTGMFILVQPTAGGSNQVGLYDAKGKRITIPQLVPLHVVPESGAAFVKATPANGAIASVGMRSDGLAVTAQSEGSTSVRFDTECGPLDTSVDIEVVPCTEDVQAELQREKEQLIRREKTLVERATQLLGDDEFIRADNEGVADIIEMATKLGETIVGALSMGESGAAKQALATKQTLNNAKNLGVVGTAWDTYNNVKDFAEGNHGKAAFGATVQLAGAALDNDKIGFAKTLWEASQAAEKMGQDLGTILSVANELETLAEQQDGVRKQLDDVFGRLKLCKRSDAGQGDDLSDLLTPLAPPRELVQRTRDAQRNLDRFRELHQRQMQAEQRWGKTLDAINEAAAGPEEKLQEVLVTKKEAIIDIGETRGEYVRRGLPLLDGIENDAKGLAEMLEKLKTIKYGN